MRNMHARKQNNKVTGTTPTGRPRRSVWHSWCFDVSKMAVRTITQTTTKIRALNTSEVARRRKHRDVKSAKHITTAEHCLYMVKEYLSMEVD